MDISHYETLAKAVEFKEEFKNSTNITNFFFYLKGMGYNTIDGKEMTIDYLSSFVLIISRNVIKKDDILKLNKFLSNLLLVIDEKSENGKLIEDLIVNLNTLYINNKTIEIV